MKMFPEDFIFRWSREHEHAAIALVYGAWMQLTQSLSSPSSTNGARALSNFALRVAPHADPEALWGSLMLIAGGVAIFGLFTNRMSDRAWGAGLLASLWLLMACCFVVWSPRSPGVVVYLVLSWSAFTRALQLLRPCNGTR